MNWIFYALLGAAILHVVEEYAFPGGFLAFIKKMARPFAPYVTNGFAIVINGMFLLLVLVAALISRDAVVFRLAVAALCGINGLTHLGGSLRSRQYVPGLMTGLLLYLPFAILAYILYARAGQLTPWGTAGSLFIGVLYQAVPLGCLGLLYILKRA